MNEVTTEKIIALAANSHATAVSKGWWTLLPSGAADFSSRSIRSQFMLAISELNEAGEVWRNKEPVEHVWYENGKPEGFPIEMADFVIRVCDTLAASGYLAKLDMEDDRCESMVEDEGNVLDMLYDAACALVPYEGHSISDQSKDFLVSRIEAFVWDCGSAVNSAFDIARRLNFDLWSAISIKEAYNKTREIRHGGKLA